MDPHTSRIADRWCITDVRFKEKLPIERWTWVEAPFNENRAVWQHPMGDDVWRLDFQLGWKADPEVEKQPERVLPRIRAMLGPDVEFRRTAYDVEAAISVIMAIGYPKADEVVTFMMADPERPARNSALIEGLS